MRFLAALLGCSATAFSYPTPSRCPSQDSHYCVGRQRCHNIKQFNGASGLVERVVLKLRVVTSTSPLPASCSPPASLSGLRKAAQITSCVPLLLYRQHTIRLTAALEGAQHHHSTNTGCWCCSVSTTLHKWPRLKQFLRCPHLSAAITWALVLRLPSISACRDMHLA